MSAAQFTLRELIAETALAYDIEALYADIVFEYNEYGDHVAASE
jgi:hypothetical protein